MLGRGRRDPRLHGLFCDLRYGALADFDADMGARSFGEHREFSLLPDRAAGGGRRGNGDRSASRTSRVLADDPAYGVSKSYDGDAGTKWNPQVKTNYAGEPGVIYQFNRAANLNKIAITVSGAFHYFDIYTSVDGTIFTLLKQVNADNENEVYSGLICTLDNLGLEGVTHIKLVLTGRSNNSTYINLQEVEIGE